VKDKEEKHLKDILGKVQMSRITQLLIAVFAIFFSTTWLFAQQQRNIGILPFYNNSGKNAEWLGNGIEYYLYNKLPELSALSVYEQETLSRQLKEMNFVAKKTLDAKTAFSVGKKTGIEVIYTGDYSLNSDQLTLNLSLVSTYTGAPIFSRTVTGVVDQLFSLLNSLILESMDVMQLPVLAEEKKILNQPLTTSVKAYELFSNAYLEIEHNAPLELITGLFQRAIIEDANFLDARYNLGVIYYNSRWYDKANEQFDEIIRINSSFYRAYYGKGVIAYLQKSYPLAIQHLRKALQYSPNFDRAYFYLGVVYVKADSLKLGIQHLEKSIDINPNYAPAHYHLGVAEMKRGWFKRAISSLTRAIQLNPDLYLAHNALGEAYYAINAFEEAIIEFNKAIALNPKFATAYFNLGNAIYRQGALAEIVDAFWALLEVQYVPKDGTPIAKSPIKGLEELRNRSKSIGDEKAIQRKMINAYKTALKYDNRFYEASYNLALTYENLSMPDSAIYFHKLAISQKPDLAQAHMRLAKIYETQKKYDLALQHYKSVVRYQPDYFATNPKLGEHFRYMNIVETVLNEYIAKVEKNPSDKEALEVIGKIYLSLGRLGQAEQYFEKLLAVSPDDPMALKTLNQIRRQLQKM
jgi:tetratricopeptide (TPR) repeat protein